MAESVLKSFFKLIPWSQSSRNKACALLPLQRVKQTSLRAPFVVWGEPEIYKE